MRALAFNGLTLMRRGGGVTMPASVTMRFGAKTLAGAGAWRPVDSANVPVDLVSYDSLVSGSLGAYTPSILNGGIRFTGGGAGAPAGAVLRCTHARGGTIDLTVGSLIANEYSCSIMDEVDPAFKAASLGDTIRLRARDYNMTAIRWVVSRNTTPAGTWAGLAIDNPGNNWLVITRDPGAAVRIGAIEISNSASGNPVYTRVNDLDFVGPFNADGNGVGTGVSLGTSGLLFLNTIGAAATNNRMGHITPMTGETFGAFRAITTLSGVPVGQAGFWIEGNTVNGAHSGVIGSATGSVIRGNTFRRITNDVLQFGYCSDALIEFNTGTEKLYTFRRHTVSVVTRGAQTVLTVPTTVNINTLMAGGFSGFSGAFGAAINGQVASIASVTATTVTLNIDTSGLPAWDGVAGELHTSTEAHGDYFQVTENLGTGDFQNRVTLRGNVFYDGDTGGSIFPSAQGIFCGNSGSTDLRTGWLVEGNIVIVGYVHGITIANLRASTIRANTVARVLGVGNIGNQFPAISIGADCQGTTLRDNMAPALTLNSGGVIESTNNVTVPITLPSAIPADPASVASYVARFVDPVTVPSVSFDAITRFATRQDAGGAYNGFSIFPGATPYMNFGARTYTNPRAGQAPAQFGTGDWTLTNPGTGTTLAVGIVNLPQPGEFSHSVIEYRIDGGSWVSSGGVANFTITGLTPGVEVDVELRLKNTGNVTGLASAIKSATPQASVALRNAVKTADQQVTAIVTLPTYSTGDLLVVSFQHNTSWTPTTPSGWMLRHYRDAVSGGETAISLYARTATGSEGTTLSVTQPNNQVFCAFAMSFQNSTGLGAVASAKETSNAPTAPSVPATAGSLIVNLWSANAPDITPPTGDGGTPILSQTGSNRRTEARLYGPVSAGATPARDGSMVSSAPNVGITFEILA